LTTLKAFPVLGVEHGVDQHLARMCKVSQRFNETKAAALKAFWDVQQGGVLPFPFYNLAEGAYDPTGNSTPAGSTVALRRQPRYAVHFPSTMPATSDTEAVGRFRMVG
jgi:hypothetical protein